MSQKKDVEGNVGMKYKFTSVVDSAKQHQNNINLPQSLLMQVHV